MRHARKVLAVAVLLFFAGCGGIKPEGQRLLWSAAINAKERAVVMATLAKTLRAKDPADAEATARYLREHVDGLAADAKALEDWVRAVEFTGKLSQNSRQAIGAMAENAADRAKNWTAARPKLRAEGLPAEEWEAIAVAHANALTAVAKNYADLYQAVKPKEPAP
jgi:hypothetical protein